MTSEMILDILARFVARLDFFYVNYFLLARWADECA